MKKFIKLICFLFSVFLCATSLPGIANAEEGNDSGFPVNEAGMAAYVKLDSISQTTFDNATANLFLAVESFGSNYMIGTKDYYAYGASKRALVPLHIYLNTDGWLAIYLLKDQEASMMVNWNSGASLSDNVLKLAINDAVGKLNASYNNSSIKYYDFQYPDASKMSLVRENVEPGDVLSNDFTILVPGTIYRASYALASFGGGLNSYTSYVKLYLDGKAVDSIRDDTFIYGPYDGSLFTAGTSHTISITKRNDEYPGSVATLILYSVD